MTTPPVSFAPLRPAVSGVESAGPFVRRVIEHAPTDVRSALVLALEWGADEVSPGRGVTRDLWEALATIAATDLGVARAIEPHLDALAILEQAEIATAGLRNSTWGVFAAEGGDDPLTASGTANGWSLSGTKPWCSLADQLDRALVTAHVGDERNLFSVDLRSERVHVATDAWVGRGLTEIPSGPVRFDGVVALPVGRAGWYLSRPGFAWGGIGVAACWFGAAVGIARTVFDNDSESPFYRMHLGAIDELLQSSRRALAEAAALVDSGDATGPAGTLLAKRVRATIARSCEEILVRAGHALGPAPLALDAAHAKRVADLTLYVRQHHGERDEESLGRALASDRAKLDGGAPW